MTHEPGRPLVLVGLMSGTSHDGISAAVVRFHETDDAPPRPEVLAFVQQSYDGAFRARLLAAIAGPTAPVEYARLDFELGALLGAAAMAAIAESGVPRSAPSRRTGTPSGTIRRAPRGSSASRR